jgi:RNA recognition motif-containing protein
LVPRRAFSEQPESSSSSSGSFERGFRTRAPREPVKAEDIKGNGIILTNLPYGSSAETVKDFLQGADVTYIRILRNGDGSPLGKALIMFSTIDEARKTVSLDNTEFVLDGISRKVFVRPLHPKEGQQGEGQGREGGEGARRYQNNQNNRYDNARRSSSPPRPALYVKGMPANTTWQELRAFFGPDTTGVSVRVSKDDTPYAVVYFKDEESVEEALGREQPIFKNSPLQLELFQKRSFRDNANNSSNPGEQLSE